MSDTDDEIVPDSQMPTMDSSMISISNIPSIVLRTDSGKRRRADVDLSDDEDTDLVSQLSTIERGTMDEHLSCGICLSILENPFMVLPCMHSYDRECLAEWWKSNANCPVCKQRSSAAKYNFHLANIIFQYRKDTRRLSKTEVNHASREDLYPRGRRPHQSLPSSYAQSQSQSQSQSQYDPMIFNIPGVDDVLMNSQSQSQSQSVLTPLADPFPGGNLVFPCPSCPTDNAHHTGYVCPQPIEMPTQAQIAAEQQAYRPAGPPLREPSRGEPRVPLQAARLNLLPGATTHNQCRGCSTYIPAGWEPAKQRCGECGIVLCSNYDIQGTCPDGLQLRPRHALAGDNISAQILWETCPGNVRFNNVELQRFTDYIAANNITVDNILENSAECERQIEIAAALPGGGGADDDEDDDEGQLQREEEANGRWGPDVYLCDEAVEYLVRCVVFG
ncbi:hypothetical protein FRB96_003057 [Tulasnella sp. 330]|nr:hypothetical protein FRB96_003057 [Tulasnella sp. 330]